jgi:hypothetical protein
MTQDFGFIVVLGKQAHSKLRNYFCSAAVEPKDKSYSGIIEFSLLGPGIKPAVWKMTTAYIILTNFLASNSSTNFKRMLAFRAKVACLVIK